MRTVLTNAALIDCVEPKPVERAAVVIEKGRIRFEGTMDELSSNEEVKRKYLML